MDIPHSCSKKLLTSFLSTFLSMFATYTVLLQRSTSSPVRGISSLFTGMIAVLDGSTLRGELPRTEPVLSKAYKKVWG